jgi:hypothetical protein
MPAVLADVSSNLRILPSLGGQGIAAAKCDRLDHEDEFIDQLGS